MKIKSLLLICLTIFCCSTELLYAQSPGGVSDNLGLWLKADNGPDSMTNGADINNWTDQSPNGYTAGAGGNTNRPTYVTAGQNFNPALNFGAGPNNIGFDLGSDYLFAPVANGGQHIFSVVRPTNSGARKFIYDFGFYAGSNIGLALSTTQAVIAEADNDEPLVNPNPNGVLVEADFDFGIGGISSLLLDGETAQSDATGFAEITAATIDESPTSTNISGPVTIGRQSKVGVIDNDGGRRFFGDMSEVIVFNQELSEPQERQVRSYLAIKYGITLGASIADYLDSNGSSIYNVATNSNDIFGIGNDLGSNLDQQISKSVNSGAIVTVSTDANFTGANGTHTSLTDGQYLVIGNDGGDPTMETSTEFDATAYTSRIDREWRVENTNTVGAVNLKFDGFDNTYELLSDADGDFSTGAVSLGNLNADGEITNVTLTDGQFFTLTQIPTPGGVSTDLALWLKADTGTSTTTDGATVSLWGDQSGVGNDANQATPANQATYESDATSAMNFNPVIRFNGTSNRMGLDPVQLVTGDAARSFYIVTKTAATAAGFNPVLGYGTGGLGNNLDLVSSTNRISTSTNGHEYGVNSGTNLPHIVSAVLPQGSPTQTGDWTLFLNAANLTEVNIAGSPLNITTGTNAAFIGQNEGGGSFFDGDIVEVIMYAAASNSTEQQKIESYLALKYGISLDQSTVASDDGTGDYLASNGTVIFDAHDGTNVNAYKNDIFGIGNETAQGLDQQISKSVNAGAIVTVSTDTDFTAANGTHMSLTDGQYLVIGNDGGDPTMQTSTEFDATEFASRIDREWRVENTNTVGAVNLKFDGFDNTYELLSDADGDFSTGAVSLGNLNADGEITNVTLTDGQFFTLAQIPTPGGVSTDLALWLKANDNGGVTTDGTALATWSDVSGNANNATEATNQPDFRNNTADNINFNPVVEFNGTNDEMSLANPAGLPTGSGARTYFGVMLPGKAGNQNQVIDHGFDATRSRSSLNITTNRVTALYSDTNSISDHSLTGPIIGVNTYGAGQSTEPGSVNRANGLALTDTNISGTSIPNTATTSAFIGRGVNSSFAEGTIAEVIVFNRDLDDTAGDIEKIESYLAIKYGITLDASSADYVDSNGTSVYNLASYSNDVFGIANDAASALDQQISKSVNTGAALTVSTDTDFTAANGAHVSLTDGQYLVIGNDGGDPTMETSTEFDAAVYTARIDREWRVENTGMVAVGPVNLKFDGFDTTYELLSDADGDFSTGAVSLGSLDANGEITGITLTDGIFLTIAIDESPIILAEVLEDSNSTGGADNANMTAVTATQLGAIIGIMNVDPANEAAYQAAINAETGFSNPPTVAEVQALITAVNAAATASAAALAEVLEDSNSTGGADNANMTAVTAAQLGAITGIMNVDPANETAYQAAINAETGFSNPPTVAEVQAIIDAVNAAATASAAALAEVLEDSNSTGGADNANMTAVTAAQLGAITGIMNVDPANEAAYQAAINAETGFSNPPTVAEVQAIIDAVNAAATASSAALAEVLEDSNSTGGADNANMTAVTAAQLGTIIGIMNVDPANEAAYQAAINAETGFSNPPTVAEVQAIITAVNAAETASAAALAEVLEDSNSTGGADNANMTAVTAAQLGAITGIMNVDPANEAAYQAAINAETGFSNPPTVGEVQAIITAVNAAATASAAALAEVLEDSASTGGANNTNGTAVTAAQLAAITGITGVDPANETAYQAAIAAETGFSNPPTVAEVQAIITAVNAAATASAAALAEVLEDSDSTGGANNTNGTAVTAAQLAAITGITGVDPANEAAYQAAIAAETGFSNPPTAAQVQAVIDEVNNVATVVGSSASNSLTQQELTDAGVTQTGLTPAQLDDIEIAINDANPKPVTTAELQVIVDSALNILDVGDYFGDNFSILPNPASGIVHISIEVQQVTIYAITGAKVMTAITNTFDISSLEAGVYFVRIETDKGTAMKRLVKD